MEKLTLSLLPSLSSQPTLLAIVSVLFTLFFGSIIFAWIKGLFDK